MAKKENSPLEEISQAVNIEQVATSENIQVDEIKKNSRLRYRKIKN